MKKIKIALLVLGVLLLTACGSKKAITGQEFINTMLDQNFKVLDVKEDQFSDYEEIKEAYVALSENEEYQIEFYVLDNNDSAVRLYNHNKEIFEDSKSGMSTDSYVNLKNLNKYTLSTDGRFKVLSRIDNTMAYLNVESEYKDEVTTILKKLGY